MPETAVTPSVRVKFVVVIVKGSISSLKVAEFFLLSATPPAPFTGSVSVTVGAVVSGAVPVVKVQT